MQLHVIQFTGNPVLVMRRKIQYFLLSFPGKEFISKFTVNIQCITTNKQDDNPPNESKPTNVEELKFDNNRKLL